MANNIIDNSTTVELGNGLRVSMQVVQDIYSKITGRTEKISKSYKQLHQVEIDDIRQLHAKICQLCEQYNIVSKTEAVTVYHSDDHTQVFSSFERFGFFDTSSVSAIENISLSYDFLIVLPQTEKPQAYKVDVNIHSRTALMLKSKDDFMADMFAVFSRDTGNSQISFVDYAVAKNFQHTIDQWFAGLPAKPYPMLLNFVQSNSHYIPSLFRIVMISVFAFTVVSTSITTFEYDAFNLFYMSVVTFTGAFIVQLLGYEFGRAAEKVIDRITPISCLCITRGDKTLRDRVKKSNSSSAIKIATSFVLGVVVNVASYFVLKLFS